MRVLTRGLAIGIVIGLSGTVQAADDFLNLYKEEATIVSASLRPQPAKQTPATVYVVTQQDIKDSGATTFWDALRNVPALEIMHSRTGQADIGMRGINGPYNNHVLVMIDNRSVLDGYFDHILWESLPITLDEVDRIEVVEGPASAVYGPNAVSGVINIITRSPEQVQGGKATYTGGERNTQQGSILVGKKNGALGYRMNGGWRSTNRFENADALASEAGLFNGLVSYDISENAGVSLSGGFNNYNTLASAGGFGLVQDKGLTSFTRADAHYKETRLRAFWNGGRSDPQTSFNTQQLKVDQYDVTLDQSFTLPWKNKAVLGGTYHGNSAQAQVMNNGTPVHQDLWGIFMEDKWEMAEKWLLMLSGRVDRHPLTPIRFSPRGSLLYTPAPEHVFRVSAGTSYRNPTLLENYFTASLPPTIPGTTVTAVGNPELMPETMKSVEISHTGHFQRFKTNITGFYYRFENSITEQPDLSVFPSIFVPVRNSNDPISALGGEVGGEVLFTSSIRGFANYAYQSLQASSHAKFPAQSAPRHKVNTGIRTQHGGFTTGWEVHWVDSSFGQGIQSPLGSAQPVNAYFLVNAHVGYAFSGRWNGLELGVNAFNLLNHDHYEAFIPDGIHPGNTAEEIRSRFTGTVSYKF